MIADKAARPLWVIKYIALLLRADNHGEGGTLSLTALACRALQRGGGVELFLGMIGAAMFYGSVLITPALSVLRACLVGRIDFLSL